MTDLVMVEDPKKMAAILPAWFCERMACDEWAFGILMNSGVVICISKICSISSDGKWIDAILLSDDSELSCKSFTELDKLTAMTPDRTSISIHVAQIQAAFEIKES